MWISQVKRSVKEARRREYIIYESVYTMCKTEKTMLLEAKIVVTLGRGMTPKGQEATSGGGVS